MLLCTLKLKPWLNVLCGEHTWRLIHFTTNSRQYPQKRLKSDFVDQKQTLTREDVLKLRSVTFILAENECLVNLLLNLVASKLWVTFQCCLFSFCVQGGDPCVFTFTPELHPGVTSVYAEFEGLGTQELEHLKLGSFPGL